MAKELLGTAVTDENGIATFTYTGQGRGKMNIVAESGELVSETYEVIDAIFKDTGTDDSMDSNYQTPSSNFKVTHSSDGATMICSATTGTNNRYTKLNNSKNWRDSNTNYQIECDFEFDNGSNGGSASVIFGNARIGLSSLVGGTLTGSGHLTIVSSGDNYIIKLNGTQVGSTQNMTNSDGFGFVFYRDVTIKFNDLVIYTI